MNSEKGNMEATKVEGKRESKLIWMIDDGVLHQLDQQTKKNTTLKIFIFKCGHSYTFKLEQV